jgi:hypothetical protein
MSKQNYLDKYFAKRKENSDTSSTAKKTRLDDAKVTSALPVNQFDEISSHINIVFPIAIYMLLKALSEMVMKTNFQRRMLRLEQKLRNSVPTRRGIPKNSTDSLMYRISAGFVQHAATTGNQTHRFSKR